MFNFRKIKDVQNATFMTSDYTLREALGLNETTEMNVAVYLTCLRILSESMAKLPIKIYTEDVNGNKQKNSSHWLNNLLNYQANPLQSAYILRQQAEVHRWHYGNAYLWVDRKAQNIWLLDPTRMMLLLSTDGTQLVYQYGEYKFLPNELIHLKSPFTDKYGVKGIALKTYLANLLSVQSSGDKFLKSLAESGMGSQKVIMNVGVGGETISDDVLKTTIANIEKFSSLNSGKILPLPPMVDLKPLDLKLTDSQFAELRQISSQEISAAFGIPAAFLNDLSKSSYASLEQQQLNFLVNTLQPILIQYETEFYNKLFSSQEKSKGFYISFNTNALIRTTAQQQAEYLSKLTGSGLMTLNEARAKLDLNQMDTLYANELIIGNGASIPLSMLGTQYTAKNEKGGN